MPESDEQRRNREALERAKAKYDADTKAEQERKRKAAYEAGRKKGKENG